MGKHSDINSLLSFLDNSPTAWHAVANCIGDLEKQGFKELNEKDSWHVIPGGKYYVQRYGSSLCAFIIPSQTVTSLNIVAAHTDSPSFKIKPNAEFIKENMIMLGLEIYGAPLLSSWLNRDLGIAGRVIFKNEQAELQEELVNLRDCPVVIPQLAIHLDRNVNENGLILNKQEHLAAIASLIVDDKKKADTFLERQLKKYYSLKSLITSELFLYPLEKACLVAENNELISSYRLDNLLSVQAGLVSFLSDSPIAVDKIKMIVFWDNEEIGSNTAQGASSPFLMHIIERITLALKSSREDYFKILNQSLCISVDLAHAIHPNYSDKHEPRHPALMNRGVAIKTSAQQRYGSNINLSTKILEICNKNKIPFQHYISKGDIPSGSTVGPLSATRTGISTIDIGCTQLSMHSCRELSGAIDYHDLCKLLTKFLHE